MTPTPSPSDAAAWWWQALSNGVALEALAAMAASVALLVLAGRAWLRLHPRSRAKPHADHQAGTATIEFALVFPVVLFLVLVLLQTTLLLASNFFVHYAAFAATRTAIVQIPADLTPQFGEPRNVIVPSRSLPKFRAIHRAAVLAVMPVSGRHTADVGGGSDIAADADEFVDGLRSYFLAQGQTAPPWVRRLAADRLRYAAANTTVTLLWTETIGGGRVQFRPLAAGMPATFGPRDPVTVEVSHRLNLSVPYARSLFADGRHPGDRGAYTEVATQYTLTNAGTDPALPPEPPLPRRP